MSIKCWKIVKNAVIISSNVLFCLINNPKSKDIQFTVTYNTEKLQTFKFLAFLLKKMTKPIILLSKYIYFQLIN